MKYISLFSGVEAATLAWKPLGWEPICFAEVDRFPSAVLKHHYPYVQNVGDVTKVDWTKYQNIVDLVVGGSPCQSFSLAGKREGLKGESRLMYEYIRAVREIRPRWFLWENVPGAFSSDDGEAFRQLLSEMDDIGYGMAWRVLDAQFFGVAQRRRRIFLVGHLGEEPPTEVLFEPYSMSWNYSSSRAERKRIAEKAGRSVRSAGFKYNEGKSAGSLGFEDEVSPTLVANSNSSAVLAFAENQRNELRLLNDVSTCLTASRSTKQTTYVCELANTNQNGLGISKSDISNTLQTGMSQAVLTIPINEQCVQRRDNQESRTGLGIGEFDDPANTITCNHPHAVAVLSNCLNPEDPQSKRVYTEDGISPTLNSGTCEGKNIQPSIINGNYIRKLTPLECERLQGFPDNYTKIPYNGKAADECPDILRYKVIGNSFAVPVVRWIGKRIEMSDKMYEKGKTDVDSEKHQGLLWKMRCK